MRYTIKMSSRGVKITYRKGRNKWYGEFTLKDYRKGLGWFQWGASTELLFETAHITERFANEYIDIYHS